jgi:hypothetical protein
MTSAAYPNRLPREHRHRSNPEQANLQEAPHALLCRRRFNTCRHGGASYGHITGRRGAVGALSTERNRRQCRQQRRGEHDLQETRKAAHGHPVRSHLPLNAVAVGEGGLQALEGFRQGTNIVGLETRLRCGVRAPTARVDVGKKLGQKFGEWPSEKRKRASLIG